MRLFMGPHLPLDPNTNIAQLVYLRKIGELPPDFTFAVFRRSFAFKSLITSDPLYIRHRYNPAATSFSAHCKLPGILLVSVANGRLQRWRVPYSQVPFVDDLKINFESNSTSPVLETEIVAASNPHSCTCAEWYQHDPGICFSSSSEGCIKVYESVSLQEIASLNVGCFVIQLKSNAFFTQILAAAPDSCIVRLCDVLEGTAIQTLALKRKATCLEWCSRDPNILYTGDHDRSVIRWDCRTNRSTHQFQCCDVPCGISVSKNTVLTQTFSGSIESHSIYEIENKISNKKIIRCTPCKELRVRCPQIIENISYHGSGNYESFLAICGNYVAVYPLDPDLWSKPPLFIPPSQRLSQINFIHWENSIMRLWSSSRLQYLTYWDPERSNPFSMPPRISTQIADEDNWSD